MEFCTLTLTASFLMAIYLPSSQCVKYISIGGLMATDPPADQSSFSIHSYGPAQMAVKHINENPNILSGYTLNLTTHDTKPANDSKLFGIGKHVEGLQALLVSDARPLMFIQYGTTMATMTSAYITAMNGIIEFGLASSSPDLSDRDKFPYFFRTIGSLNDITAMDVDFVRAFGWKKVAMVTMEHSLEKGIASKTEIELQEKGIEIGSHQFVKLTNNQSYTSALNAIKKSNIRVILIHMSLSSQLKIMCEAYKQGMYGKSYVWIRFILDTKDYRAAMKSIKPNCTTEEVISALEGSFQYHRVSSDQALAVDKVFTTTVSGKKPNAIWTEMKKESWVEKHVRPIFYQLSYDAVWACAMALNQTIAIKGNAWLDGITMKNISTLSKTLKGILDKMEFFGASGPVGFSPWGSRMSVLSIEQTKNGTPETVGVYHQKERSISWTRNFTEIWYQQNGAVPLSAPTTVKQYLYIDEGLRVAFLVIAVVGCVMAALMAAFIIWKWEAIIVATSWPILNLMIAAGCLVVNVSIILMGSDGGITTDKQVLQNYCQASTWLIILGFTMTYGAMFLKTLGVYRFYRYNECNLFMSQIKMLIAVVGLMALDVLLLVIWQGTDPLKIVDELHPKSEFDGQSFLVYQNIIQRCTSPSSMTWTIIFFCYKGILLLGGIVFIWPAWIVSNRMGPSDIQHLGIVMMVCVLSSLIGVPVATIEHDNPSVKYGVVGAFVLLCTVLTTVLLTLPKFLAVRRGADAPTLLSSPMYSFFDFMEDFGVFSFQQSSKQNSGGQEQQDNSANQSNGMNLEERRPESKA